MTADPSIRAQSYGYFQQEATELLQEMEEALFAMQQGYTVRQMHSLMRIAHTLKGASASLELTTIEAVAHTLEDAYKALCHSDLDVNSQLMELLFQGYECLRDSLQAEFAGTPLAPQRSIDRASGIVRQLEELAGDDFRTDTEILSSAELGFDLTQSMFELGVNQRLEQLEQQIASQSAADLAESLQTHCSVFLGLAESLGLVGFGRIAEVTANALSRHPDRVADIARLALADFRQGKAAVLDGDREVGGHPSLALQEFGDTTGTSNNLKADVNIPSTSTQLVADTSNSLFTEAENPLEDTQIQKIDGGWLWEGIEPTASEVSALGIEIDRDTLWGDNPLETAGEMAGPAGKNELLDSVWGEGEDELASIAQELKASPATHPSRFAYPLKQEAADNSSRSKSVRVNIEQLDRLNYYIAEILTLHNRQTLQSERLQEAVRALFGTIDRHQNRLDKLRDWSERQSTLSMRDWHQQVTPKEWRDENVPDGNNGRQERFDPLELERYTDAQDLLIDTVDTSLYLTEAAGELELLAREIGQFLEKERLLLTNSRNTLMDARMVPLGTILDRLPRILKQLENRFTKSVTLKLTGQQVLVDKAVVEQLYDPLLHLIRNAFDHGIESADDRRAAGKPLQGKIAIQGDRRGSNLILRVQDDGGGIDLELIRQRALEKNVLPADTLNAFSDRQLLDLLFHPGFSTVERVSDISGRGVGLDVVKSRLDALQGYISIETEQGRGTTFAINIPLKQTFETLLLCQVGFKTYAFLAEGIEHIVVPRANQLAQQGSKRALRWGDGPEACFIPIRSLDRILGYNSSLPEPDTLPPGSFPKPSNPSNETVLLVKSGDSLQGISVDCALAEQESIVRPLGSLIAPPSYVCGGTVLADGRLALVIDGENLVDRLDTLSTPNAIHAENTSARTIAERPEERTSSRPISEWRLTIMVIDDSLTQRMTLGAALEKAGYRVLLARDGRDALNQLQERAIDLAFCDIEMPGMNGYEFLSKVKQIPNLSEVPVVMLSSRTAEKHRTAARELGASAYLTKPFVESIVLKTIEEILQLSSPMPTAP